MTLAYLGFASKISSSSLVAATSKTSSSGSSTLLILLIAFAAMYFLWLRPQRKKLQQRQLDQVRSFDVGDEVVTQSGIIGTIVSLTDDRAEIQISSGVVITVVRAAIGRRLDPVVPEAPEEEDTTEEQSDYFYTPEVDEPVQPEKRNFWQRRNRGGDS